MNQLQYEQATILLPNGKPINVGVPVLETRERDLGTLIAEMYRKNPRKYAKHAPTGNKPGTVCCALCRQSVGTLVKVEAQGRQAYVHADCQRDVAVVRVNRISRAMREMQRSVSQNRAAARRRARG